MFQRQGVTGGRVDRATVELVREIILDGSFVRDPMSDVLKTGLLLVSLFAFVYAKDYLKELGILRGEYYVLGLFAVLGMMVMI